MSECVVRVKMPQNCWLCPSGNQDWIYKDEGSEQMVCFCNICDTEEENRYITETEDNRPDWCPIICQLPEGHGRLGDLDELERKIDGARIRVMQDGQDTNPYWECGDIIVSEKTIVPAERSET